MRISVLVAAYNGERWLRKCLDSLVAQDLPVEQRELWVIDDGSTDGTARILAEYAGRGLLRHVRQANQGTAGALTTGLHCVTGDVVAIISQDCFAEPHWLRRVAGAFADPAVGIARWAILPAQEIRVPFAHCTHVERPSKSFDGASIAFRVAALDQAGRAYDAYLSRRGDDADLGWRVIEAGWREAWIPQALTYHEVVPVGFWDAIRHAPSQFTVPLLARRHPGLRRHLKLGFLWGGPWQYLRLAALGLGIGSLGAGMAPVGAALLAVSYLLYLRGSLPRRCSLWHRLLSIPANGLLSEVISEGASLAGSIRFRRLVL